jgi:hypothetical protein
MFLRRLGRSRKSTCTEAVHCPDLFELADGSFAVIGTDITKDAVVHLKALGSCGPTERIVKIPRHVLIAAKDDIPSK